MVTPERKRRGPLLWFAGRRWWFWIVVSVLLPTSYVASFGPMCWICDRNHSWFPQREAARLYRPLIRAAFYGPDFVQRPLRAYAEWFAPPLTVWIWEPKLNRHRLDGKLGPLERLRYIAR